MTHFLTLDGSESNTKNLFKAYNSKLLLPGSTSSSPGASGKALTQAPEGKTSQMISLNEINFSGS